MCQLEVSVEAAHMPPDVEQRARRREQREVRGLVQQGRCEASEDIPSRWRLYDGEQGRCATQEAPRLVEHADEVAMPAGLGHVQPLEEVLVLLVQPALRRLERPDRAVRAEGTRRARARPVERGCRGGVEAAEARVELGVVACTGAAPSFRAPVWSSDGDSPCKRQRGGGGG